MNRVIVSFDGKKVVVGNHVWHVRWTVSQVEFVDGRVIVLYDYMAAPPREHFANLEAFAPDGSSLWMAEHPIRTATDSYVSISVDNDESLITAYSFAGFTCKIATSTGKLVNAEFTK